MKKQKQCQKAKRFLNAYIDDELTVKERETVRTHLNICTHCRLEYDKLVNLNDSLADLGEISCPESIKDRLKHIPEIDSKRISFLRVTYRLQPISIAASVLLTIFSALFLGNNLTKNHSDELPTEYQLAQESLYSYWEDISYE